MPSITVDIDTTEAEQKINALIERADVLKTRAVEAAEAFSSIPAPKQSEDADTDAVIKKGSRNNRKDAQRIQDVHDHSVGLGAHCASAAKSADIDAETLAVIKEVPLNVLVSEVNDAFWRLRTEERKLQAIAAGKDPDEYWGDWNSDLCASCVATYEGYAIAKVGLTYYKVKYKVTDLGVDLAPREEWETVEQEWVAKSVPMRVMRDAQRREAGVVKSIKDGRLGNYLVLWGDDKNRDLYGEYFTKNTAGLTAMFDHLGKLPALYQHAMDNEVKYTPIGTIDKMEIDDLGLWTETQLDMANRYAQQVQVLARKRALGASSGTLPGARKAVASGEITQWVIIEGSFTPTPAEPRMRELGVAEVKSIYTECGLELPDQMDVVLKSAEGAEEVQSDVKTAEMEAEEQRLRLLELELSLI